MYTFDYWFWKYVHNSYYSQNTTYETTLVSTFIYPYKYKHWNCYKHLIIYKHFIFIYAYKYTLKVLFLSIPCQPVIEINDVRIDAVKM